MIEVGAKQLKSHLSHYLRLVERGETIAVKIRKRVVGFLSNLKPSLDKEKELSIKELKKKIEQWKKEGMIYGGGIFKYKPVKRIRLKGDKTSTQMIREMRDEW